MAPASRTSELVQFTDQGLFCAEGGFYIDPKVPVDRAVITHAHADHARPGSRRYLTARPGWRVVHRRLRFTSSIDLLEYGEEVNVGGVRISLHPAGHMLGSAQVRLERDGEVWVVSGDYKLDADPTASPFVPVPCHTFVTEATFADPVYHWPPAGEVLAAISAWRRENAAAGRASILFCHALGKAQRLLALLGDLEAPLVVHETAAVFARDYRETGVTLPQVIRVRQAPRDTDWAQALILAPPRLSGSRIWRRVGPAATALASGWVGGWLTPERLGVERGFVLSDHADWQGVLRAVHESRAERVWTMHGHAPGLALELRRMGIDAQAWEAGPTPFAIGSPDSSHRAG